MCAFRKHDRQLSTLKSRSTFGGMTVGYLELSRYSPTFRDLRLFGHNGH